MPEQAPAFSTVNAYLLSDFPASQQPSPGVAPPAGITVRSSVVMTNLDGVVAMTGLADDTAYVFGDNTDAAGKWRYWRVRTSKPATATLPGVNAADYGADKTGTVDSTAAIQAAIDAVAGSAYSGGGTVNVPAGTYLIGSPGLQMKANVRLKGDGNGTILRATGDAYFIVNCINANNGAYRSRIEDMAFDASSQQTSGGAISSTASQGTWTIKHVTFGSNLYSCINHTPSSGAGGGRLFIKNIRVLSLTASAGASGISKAFVFNGSSTVQLVEIYGSHWDCTAAAGQATEWLDLKRADTFQLQQALFQNGTKGLTTSNDGAGNSVTSCRFTSCVWDSQTTYGLSIDYVKPIDFTDCQVVSCTAAGAAVAVGSNARGFSWIGGMISRNTGHGVSIASGALHTRFHACKITDNNQGNTAATYGVAVAAGTTDFELTEIEASNALYSGHQKQAVNIAAGASDRYVVAVRCKTDADLAVPVGDGGTGTNKSVTGGAGTLASLKRRLWLPSGVIDENYPRYLAVASQDAGDMVSGSLYVFGGLVIPAGVTVSNIELFGAATVTATGTHLWACLIDQSRNVLVKTNDDTSAAPVTANTKKTLALASAYTPAVDTPVYVGLLQTFTGSASRFYGWAQSTGGQNLLGGQTGAPMLAGTSSGGLTNPASLGATAAAFGATNIYYHCRLT